MTLDRAAAAGSGMTGYINAAFSASQQGLARLWNRGKQEEETQDDTKVKICNTQHYNVFVTEID